MGEGDGEGEMVRDGERWRERDGEMVREMVREGERESARWCESGIVYFYYTTYLT